MIKFRDLKGSEKPVAPVNPTKISSVVLGLKRKKNAARIAASSSALWLQEAAFSILSAIGANIMIWSGGRLLVAQNKYERSAAGMERLVASFQFKCSVKFYHFLFRFQQRIYKRHLALTRPSELIIDLAQREFDVRRVNAVAVRLSQSFASYLQSAETALDEFGCRLTALDQLIIVHPNLPIPEILKNSSTSGQFSK